MANVLKAVMIQSLIVCTVSLFEHGSGFSVLSCNERQINLSLKSLNACSLFLLSENSVLAENKYEERMVKRFDTRG